MSNRKVVFIWVGAYAVSGLISVGILKFLKVI